MIIGENNNRSHPTIHISQLDPINDPTVMISSPLSSLNLNAVNDYPHSPSPYLDSFASLFRYLPSNELINDDSDDSSLTDEFRMYEFKIRRCARGRSHDWTECPFAHPGEKARRRDPRKCHYSGAACPEFRKGNCRRGDSCEFAHGVFECWLHPARYRTQPCKDGTSCRRRICFFAHTREQLRGVPGSLDPDLGFFSSKSDLASSPISILDSPSFSPSTAEIIASIRKMQLNGGCSWSSAMRSGIRLPFRSSLRPIQTPTWRRIMDFDIWECEREEAPAMAVVESGKELRAEMYAKLSRENSLG